MVIVCTIKDLSGDTIRESLAGMLPQVVATGKTGRFQVKFFLFTIDDNDVGGLSLSKRYYYRMFPHGTYVSRL